MKNIFNLLKFPIYILLSGLIILGVVASAANIEALFLPAFILLVLTPYVIIPYLFCLQAREAVYRNDDFSIPLCLCLLATLLLSIIINPLKFMILDLFKGFSIQIYLMYLLYIIVYSITYFLMKSRKEDFL